MFVVVWKYKINSEDRSEFESEYGHGGSWATFFRKSANYVGSKLYSGADNTYLVIDAWDSALAYDNFLEENESRYNELSDHFRYLFEDEARIGDFHEVNGATIL